ncbi:hypothetical protein SAV31267_055800 [Streptomyces avermitilis]|uniref:ADP-ribosylglycohydrolase n=1 Tax=Streptomyces avermitilis TaxID=33903 RepID=A0A4D4MXB1_STRAX|nr:hypothetical protein SAV31267_055800 [Streptomyces avermitilis]
MVGATAGAVWGRAEQQDFRSRVRGTLLGTAVGDALGAPLDALSLDEIREAHGPLGLVDLTFGHGRRGAVTQLTQLTLFSLDGLIRAQVRRDTGAWHPPTDLHRAYLRWAATQHDWGPDERRKEDGWLAREEWLYARRSPSRACLLGLADETMGTPGAPKNPGETGPEAAARSAPFGLLVGWEPQLVLQLAVECAAQTHGHPTAYLAAGRTPSSCMPWRAARAWTRACSGRCSCCRRGRGSSRSRTRCSTRWVRCGRGCRRRRGWRSWPGTVRRRGCWRSPCTARWWGRTSGTGCVSR